MTLREAVTYWAQWLDRTKPRWERLVSLETGKLDMAGQCVGCAPCVADYIFGEFISMYVLPAYQKALTRQNRQAFYASGAIPMWREEISARLAKFTPAPIPADAETVA